jgi:predicted MFS family arabinose efflux permease
MATFSVSFDVGIGIGAMLSGLLAGAVGYAGMYGIAAVVPLLGLGGFIAVGRRDRRRPATDVAG